VVNIPDCVSLHDALPISSNTNLSLFAEMRQFRRMHASIPIENILAMVTVNPAKAIRAEDFLGKIRPGYQADMIAIPATSETSSADRKSTRLNSSHVAISY